MESFCKQIGLRMKGPGMRWKGGNVTAVAALVSHWSLDVERCGLFDAMPGTNGGPALAAFLRYTRGV